MADYQYARESRTPHSEVYTIEDEGDIIGRVDLHFSSGAAYATLCVPTEYDEDDIHDLIADIDQRLVLPAEPGREDFVVTVWRGSAAGVYSEDEEDDEGEDEDESGTNGRAPLS